MDIVGTFVLVDQSIDAIYCDHFIRMRVSGARASGEYLELVGSSKLVRRQIGQLFITTAGQKTVNQSHIRSLMFPLPPLKEQSQILAKVNQLTALCDSLETHLEKAETRRAALLEAALNEALAPAVQEAP